MLQGFWYINDYYRQLGHLGANIINLEHCQHKDQEQFVLIIMDTQVLVLSSLFSSSSLSFGGGEGEGEGEAVGGREEIGVGGGQ